MAQNIFKTNTNLFKASTNVFKTDDASLGELYWDANAGTAGQTDGAGVWLAANQWWNGSTNQNWVSDSYARFGWGGTGGAVTLASPTNVRRLVLNNFSGTYTLGTAGQTITLYAGILLESTSGVVTIVSPVTLSASQLWFNRSASLLTVGTANVVLGANILTVGGTGNTTVSGVISGATGQIIKEGAGTLTLSGTSANTYAGLTTVSGGVLLLSKTSGLNAIAGNVTVSSGAILRLGASSQIPIATTLTINGGTFDMQGNTESMTPAVVLAGGTITGTSVGYLIVVNGYTGSGTNTISQRVSTIASAAGTGLFTINSGVTTVSGLIYNSDASAGGVTKAGSGTLVLTNANTFTGAVAINAGILKIGASSSVNTSSPTGTTGVVTVANGAAFDLAGFSYTGTHTQAFTINGTGIASGGAITNSGGNCTLIGPITFATAASIVGESGTIAITGTPVSAATAITLGGSAGGSVSTVIAGARTITKQGSGTWTLSGANTYTGATTISAGTLKLGVSSSLNTSGPLGTTAAGTTVADGAALDLNGFSLTSTAAEPLTLNGTGIGGLGALTNSAGSASTFIGVITFGSAASICGQGALINITGTPASGSSNITLGGAVGGTINTIIAGVRVVTKEGAGTWTLSGQNTYSSGTIVTAGTLACDGTGKTNPARILPSNGSVTVTNGTVSLLGNQLNVIFNGSGTVTLNAGGILYANCSTNNGHNLATLAMNGGSLTGNATPYAGDGHFTIRTINCTDDSTISAYWCSPLSSINITVSAGKILTCSGVIQNNASVPATTVPIKLGTGTLVLSALNTFSGGVTISDGTLSANTVANTGSNSSLGTGSTTSAITIGATGTLKYTGTGHSTNRGIVLSASGATIDASGAGTLTLTGGVTGATFGLNLTGTGNMTFTTAAIGTTSGGVTKTGSGTVTYSFANTYTGTTTVNAGSIVATVSNALSSGALTVDGATAIYNMGNNLTDTVGTVTLANGGSIQGTGTSTLTSTGSFALQDGTVTTRLAGAGIDLNKTTAGTVILSGTNSYTGATSIGGGILRLASGGSIGNSAVAVNAGGTLEGPATTGTSVTITGTVTVANSTTARIRPGSFGNNTLNTGALTFSGSSARMECDSTTTTFSLINVTGTCALGGMGLIFNAGITTNGVYNLITASSTMSGTLPVIITNNTGKTLVISQLGNNLQVTVS